MARPRPPTATCATCRETFGKGLARGGDTRGSECGRCKYARQTGKASAPTPVAPAAPAVSAPPPPAVCRVPDCAGPEECWVADNWSGAGGADRARCRHFTPLDFQRLVGADKARAEAEAKEAETSGRFLARDRSDRAWSAAEDRVRRAYQEVQDAVARGDFTPEEVGRILATMWDDLEVIRGTLD